MPKLLFIGGIADGQRHWVEMPCFKIAEQLPVASKAFHRDDLSPWDKNWEPPTVITHDYVRRSIAFNEGDGKKPYLFEYMTPAENPKVIDLDEYRERKEREKEQKKLDEFRKEVIKRLKRQGYLEEDDD